MNRSNGKINMNKLISNCMKFYMMTHFPFSAQGLFFLSGAWIRGSFFSFSSTYSLILEQKTWIKTMPERTLSLLTHPPPIRACPTPSTRDPPLIHLHQRPIKKTVIRTTIIPRLTDVLFQTAEYVRVRIYHPLVWFDKLWTQM
jgi:hypothetical protein